MFSGSTGLINAIIVILISPAFPFAFCIRLLISRISPPMRRLPTLCECHIILVCNKFFNFLTIFLHLCQFLLFLLLDCPDQWEEQQDPWLMLLETNELYGLYDDESLSYFSVVFLTVTLRFSKIDISFKFLEIVIHRKSKEPYPQSLQWKAGRTQKGHQTPDSPHQRWLNRSKRNMYHFIYEMQFRYCATFFLLLAAIGAILCCPGLENSSL